MSETVNEFAPAVAALVGRLAGGAVGRMAGGAVSSATGGAGLASRLATNIAAKATTDKVEDILSDKPEDSKEEACEKCGCEENCEECGCNYCKQKVVQKKRDLGSLENKYNIEMKERVEIVKFLKHLNEKNYAEAHKYLKNIMEAKLSKRIAASKGVKVF